MHSKNTCTFNQEEVVLINTVENNSSRYSNHDYSQAKIARKLQRTIGRPSYKYYHTIVNNKRLKNCPLMMEDAKSAEHIFGPETGCLTGKTVKKTGIAVRTNLTNLPFEILERYRSVTLSGNIMWIMGLGFFYTIPPHQVHHEPSRQECHIIESGWLHKESCRSVHATRLPHS